MLKQQLEFRAELRSLYTTLLHNNFFSNEASLFFIKVNEGKIRKKILPNEMISIACAIAVIFLSINFIRGQEKEALIFDRFNRSLFDLPDEIPKGTRFGAWAVACPAESPAELEFVRLYSSTNNALFVREIYDRGDKATEVKKNLCKESFKLSMTYHIKSSSYRFGFEIYYKLRDEDYFHDEDMQEYKTIEEAAATMASVAKKTMFVAKEYKRIVKNAVGFEIKELWFNKNRKMGFTWIDLVKFGFDVPARILQKMTYNISTNSRWPYTNEKCDSYDLGNELYRGINVDALYSSDNKNVFANLKIPETAPCGTNKDCFVKSLIIPMDQFRFGSSTSPLCSNLATVPLWSKTRAEASLKKVDQYLYSLYEALGEPLHVISGISGEHVYPKIKGRGKSTIYLDPEKKKIPIPKIIYKMIEYRVKNCKLDEKLCWYSCIIVIHNDPFFKDNHKICPSNISSDWGWQGIKINDPNVTPPDIIYVCPRDKNTMNKLLGSSKYAESPGLNLSKFPFSKDGQKIEPRSIVSDVNKKFTEFITKGEDLSLRNKKILELSQSDHDNLDDDELLQGDGIVAEQVERKEGDRTDSEKEDGGGPK